MLTHSKIPIREAITRIRSSREEAAVQNFRNLLFCMGDEPRATEWQRLAARKDILELATSDVALSDEIYIQVLKQLRGKSSARSALLGWQLLVEICQIIP